MLKLEEIELISSSNSWQELIYKSATASFFQQTEWLSLWRRHFASPKELIFAVVKQRELVGIAPFSLSGSAITFLGIGPVLGGELVSDFGDIIAKISFEESIWKEVLTKIKDYRIELDFIRENSPSFQILQRLGGRMEAVDAAPYIDLPNTWEEYLTSLGRHSRHELRRKIRKLERENAFKVCYEGEAADIDEFFRLMVLSNEQKRDFLSKKMRQFFSDIFTTFWPKKMLRLCFLKLNGVNIAAVLVFIYKDEFLLYNSGFDPQYAYLAPGLLLKAFLIKNAIKEGKKRFDFLRGGERYKYDLGGKERKLYKIRF